MEVDLHWARKKVIAAYKKSRGIGVEHHSAYKGGDSNRAEVSTTKENTIDRRKKKRLLETRGESNV